MAVDTQARTTTVSTHDELLEELVFEALCRDEIFRSLEQDSIQVDVKNGVVYLKGHLSKSLHSHHLEAIAAAVPGVRGVENRLMADRDLSLQVAQALSHDPRTRPFNIPVRAFHGWVHLGGMVPTETDRAACEQVAGSVSGVRGVITLPKLPDGSEIPPRHTLQPLPGAQVFGDAGCLGRIQAVVIDPGSRLVTHIVMPHAPETPYAEDDPGAALCCIPAAAIRAANETSAFLKHGYRPGVESPALRFQDLIRPPEDWRPPFPYRWMDIRWPAEAYDNR